ncbi:sugar O-acetyltransferase [Virgibacillus sp. LDC-1]|uniref:sugar O-acetyltransferase n=1 Tax=Virgibacillus sp. LDC-1 TaxID=3039856 RepID=UPI0024DE7F13|nr:sugar O-acetyltransferase [Virgibacillus sp. LDC-1]
MTEKEKMIQGKPYQAFGDELFQERQYAKELLYQCNTLPPTEVTQRHDLLKKLLGKVGENLYVEPPFRCDYGYNIAVGNNFYANYNCTILDCAPVTIGNNVMLAPNVSVFTAGHPVHYKPRNAGWEHALPITIGNNVWIGGGAIINPGVSIGDNTVIGSGSVVTKDIPANVVAVGNPCRVIRKITDEERTAYFHDLER